jgi:hypothetical protein
MARRFAFLVLGLSFFIGGCVGPPVLERQVLGYDDVTSELDQKLLLLNIARADAGRPVHFTTTSSIAATFDWTTTIGLGGQIEESKGTDFFSFSLGGSASENPTFSIIPISGQDFTKRILTPFQDQAFEFLVFQGGAIDRVMRLMGSGIEVQNTDGSFARFIANDPARTAEYEEFRRIATHLRWLNDTRHLFVRSLVFEEKVASNYTGALTPEDIINGSDKGLTWRQKSDGSYDLVRLRAGRVAVTNYDPMALSNEERFKLNERVRLNPKGFVYVEIDPSGPGGDFPLRGAIKLRSMLQILISLGNGVEEIPEFDVTADPRTGVVIDNPTSTLQINITEDDPDTRLASIEYAGKYYSVNDTEWDRAAFAQLGDLFQTTVGDVDAVGIPITIAK